MDNDDQINVQTLFVLIDGVADLGNQNLQSQSPLQLAQIPYMNALAQSGLCGIMDPVETGLACGSDTAHMNIFGYNPFQLYRGRGAFESMGSGLDMDTTEIAFKCNFAYMNPDTKIVEKRRVDREFHHWGLSLIEYVNGMAIPGYPEHRVTCMHATEHRCGIKISGPHLTDEITGTDPLKDNLKLREVQPKIKDQYESSFTAELINKFSDELFRKLSEHPLNVERTQQKQLPANIILLRGCGKRLDVPTFNQLQNENGFIIAPTAIISGLGQTIGLDKLVVEGATGDYHSNYINKVEAAFQSLEKQDFSFGFLHIKAIDEAGHDQLHDLQIQLLEKVDNMFKRLFQLLKEKHEKEATKKNKTVYILILTGDHTTPVLQGDHTFEPVPFVITNSWNFMHTLGQKHQNMPLQDEASKFDEIECASGILGRFPGSEVTKILQNYQKCVQTLITKN